MNDKYYELRNTIKAMDSVERGIALSCIPMKEILDYIGMSYSQMQNKVAQIEAIAKGE